MLENSQSPVKDKSDWMRLAPFAAAFVLAVAGIGYAVHEHNSAQSLNWQNQQMAAQLDTAQKQLSATNGQLSALSAKVDALATKPSPVGGGAGYAGGSMARSGGAGSGSVGGGRRVVRDSRYDKLKEQVDAQGKLIGDTQSDLASAKTELSGSIAKTHDELVVLEKRGQRNYYEFDLNKSKQFARTGPVSIALRKANWKKGYADLNLVVDDRTLQQKHVNMYQPAFFYDMDSPQPMEIVINDISKNHIHGYVSAPKYRRSELNAMVTGTGNGTAAPANQTASSDAPPLRKRLTVPKEEPND